MADIIVMHDPAPASGVRLAVGQDGRHVTFCRLCEAVCGLVATVEEGRIVKVEPDRDNPHSQGHVCVKGMGFHHVTHDPDRVTRPMRRIAEGRFEPVSWDEALDDIAARLGCIRAEHGGEGIAFYTGNPSSFATDLAMSLGPFMKALGTRKGYCPGPQDNNARAVANFALFGSAALNAFPDLPNCDYLLMLGANPLVSNCSMMYAPRIRHDLDAVAERGGVVVIDPRLTETARRYTHVQVAPNGDVWLLLALLRVLIDEGRVDAPAVAVIADGYDELVAEVLRVDLATAVQRSGISGDRIREIALTLADTPRAAVYGRVGICRGPFATLANCLVTILNIVAGKFGIRGGTIFGHRVLAGQESSTPGGYGETKSRIGGIPSVLRYLASTVMPDDILEPGPGQVRALMLTAGNPLLSAPGGERLEQALQSLDLFVAFDFYINETSRFADYVLPVPTFYERPDFPYISLNILMRPFLQVTDAVLPVQGEARHEHEIWRDLIERMGLEWPARGTNDATLPPGMARMDAMLRNGPVGDRFGEREGWSYEALLNHPHGAMVDLADPTEGWQGRIAHPGNRMQLHHPLIAAEFARLSAEWQEASALSLIGRRDIRSINSWMHNVEGLVRSQKQDLLVSHADMARLGLSEGGLARLATRHGEIEVTVSESDEVAAGTVCYPHGWGHEGGSWQRANRAPGRNVNVLLGLGLEATEFVSGTTLMDGIAVTLEPVAAAG